MLVYIFITSSGPAISANTTLIRKEILVTTTTYQRILSIVDELRNIPLSDEPWKFYSVPADQTEPIQSSWHWILSTPGIFVVSKSRWKYQVAVNLSYSPWLAHDNFMFQKLNTAMEGKELVQGRRAASWDLDACFVKDAVHVISDPMFTSGANSAKALYAPRAFDVLTTWLGGVAELSEGDSSAGSGLTGINSNPESGQIQLDGYKFSSYTLVKVSELGQYGRNLVNCDSVLSIVELEDESWELLLYMSYLPTLTQKLRMEVPDSVIDPRLQSL
ncbi:uncharacterized protein RSE6_14833 [Rhynchosporium secalis]|uniref:Uncharacterized protein n=1 Tax=Rhynchosporium secalis TaxID=38038 RepID=A0A1E1MWA1_RHYSE|nr:uncharacterized protein RSE6_14833 [Rhynchosporium secalis]